jgi:hypothetical protein
MTVSRNTACSPLRTIACIALALATLWGFERSARAQDLDGDGVLESDEVSGLDVYDDGTNATAPMDAQGDGDEAAPIDVDDADPSATVIYRDRLSPFGAWVDHPRYGTVWIPDSAVVGSSFTPYVTAGRWELTSAGDWLWVSDYSWGYIPFHYGRWVWITGSGWGWIPGRTYAPAWVVWRVGAGGFIGWAPMPPSWYWMGGVAVSFWMTPYAAYVFCPTRYVFTRNVGTRVVMSASDVRRAAESTAPYRPDASKPAGSHGHAPASPSLKAASVKPGDAPKQFARHDPRATELSKLPPATTPSGGTPAGARPNGGRPSGIGPSGGRPNPSWDRPRGARPPSASSGGGERRTWSTEPRPLRPRARPPIGTTSPGGRPNAGPSRPSVPQASSPSSRPPSPSSRPSSPPTTRPRPSAPSGPSVRPSSPGPSRMRAPTPSFAPSAPRRR